MSDTPDDKAVSKAVCRLARDREQTCVRNGLIITMYEPDKPVQIGDIGYTAKDGPPASTLYLLRFTDAGHELLTVQLGPGDGLLGPHSPAYK